MGENEYFFIFHASLSLPTALALAGRGRSRAVRLEGMKRFVFWLAILACAAGTARGQVSGVTAELILEQDQYLPDEDLQLKVHLTNRLALLLTLGQDDGWITFDISGA